MFAEKYHQTTSCSRALYVRIRAVSMTVDGSAEMDAIESERVPHTTAYTGEHQMFTVYACVSDFHSMNSGEISDN